MMTGMRNLAVAAAKWVVDAARFHAVHRRRIATMARGPGRHQVLVVCPAFDVGGGERVTLEMIRHATGEEFSFHAVATDRRAVHRWHGEFQDACVNAVVPEPWRLGRAGYLRYISALIRHLGIELLVFYENAPTFAILPELAARHPQLRIVDVTHCQNPDDVLDRALPSLPHLAQRVCVSPAVRDTVLAHYRRRGVDPAMEQRLATVLNGIDLSALRRDAQGDAAAVRLRHGIPRDAPLVLWAGRFDPVKNAALLVDVAARCVADPALSAAHFAMAGDGEELAATADRATTAGLGGRLHFTGMLGRGELLSLMRSASALAMTSHKEGMPIIAIESMALGTPVVATRCGGVDALLEPGFAGYLVDQGPGAADGLAATVGALLADESGRRAVGEAMRRHAEEHFTAGAMGARYRDLFREVLATAPPPSSACSG